jgi:hypothetical protein
MEDVFNATISGGGFTVTNLPGGVTKGTVTRTGDHTATIALSGNRTTDYDADITNVTVDVSHTELAGLTSGSLSANTGVTLHAYVESCAISSNGSLNEQTLNGDTIFLSLTNDQFSDASLSAANFTLSNNPAGTSISQAIWVNSTHAWLIVGFTGTDYDVDSTHVRVTVDETEIYGAADLVSGDITFVAYVESGLNELNPEMPLSIGPNPANDQLHIYTYGAVEGDLCLFDLCGQTLMKFRIEDSGDHRIDITSLSPGLYFLRMETGGKTLKVMVER